MAELRIRVMTCNCSFDGEGRFRSVDPACQTHGHMAAPEPEPGPDVLDQLPAKAVDLLGPEDPDSVADAAEVRSAVWALCHLVDQAHRERDSILTRLDAAMEETARNAEALKGLTIRLEALEARVASIVRRPQAAGITDLQHRVDALEARLLP